MEASSIWLTNEQRSLKYLSLEVVVTAARHASVRIAHPDPPRMLVPKRTARAKRPGGELVRSPTRALRPVHSKPGSMPVGCIVEQWCVWHVWLRSSSCACKSQCAEFAVRCLLHGEGAVSQGQRRRYLTLTNSTASPICTPHICNILPRRSSSEQLCNG